MAVKEKLLAIQAELKAPKGQTNTFGKYKYRSCEDILESVKPLLKKYKATLVISDTLELIGERYYIKATATFMDTEDGGVIENTAYARESAEKKGMDDSQVTGATSSYARKYALNGLFLIDDTKDADTDEYRNQQSKAEGYPSKANMIKEIAKKYPDGSENLTALLTTFGVAKLEDATDAQIQAVYNKVKK